MNEIITAPKTESVRIGRDLRSAGVALSTT